MMIKRMGKKPGVYTAKNGAKYKIMPNIGHFPMSENPKLFFSYLLPFLREIQKL